MLRRETEEGWILICQHDHALLSYEIMRWWDNDKMYLSEQLDEIMFAVKEHDNGWMDWDSSPRINPKSLYPASFLEMKPKEQYEIWNKCINSHIQSHPYASALIALHFNLFNERNLLKQPGNKYALKFRDEIRLLVNDLLDIELNGYDPNMLREPIKYDLRFVQIGDIISLAMCHGWESFTVENVPKRNPNDVFTMTMYSEDGFNYFFDPYPFKENDISFSIQGNRLSRKTFKNNRELTAEFENCPKEELVFTVSGKK